MPCEYRRERKIKAGEQEREMLGELVNEELFLEVDHPVPAATMWTRNKLPS